MKLTPRQVEVLKLMADGWTMHVPTTVLASSIWLQSKGIETRVVHHSTFNSLQLKGLITQKHYGFPESLWVLTAQGRQEAELRKVEP